MVWDHRLPGLELMAGFFSFFPFCCPSLFHRSAAEFPFFSSLFGCLGGPVPDDAFTVRKAVHMFDSEHRAPQFPLFLP